MTSLERISKTFKPMFKLGKPFKNLKKKTIIIEKLVLMKMELW